jgi:signal transduction histidine kinase
MRDIYRSSRSCAVIVKMLRVITVFNPAYPLLAVFICGLMLSMRERRRADSTLKTMNQRIVSLQEEERAQVDCVAIFRETRQDVRVTLGSEKLVTCMPSAARAVLRPSRHATYAARLDRTTARRRLD